MAVTIGNGQNKTLLPRVKKVTTGPSINPSQGQAPSAAPAEPSGPAPGAAAPNTQAQEAQVQGGGHVDNVGEGSGSSYFQEDTWSLQDRNASPEAKEYISKGKYLWSIAKTPEEKAYANYVAEQGRALDGYSGGADGAGFTPLGILDRQHNDTSQYESQYAEKINNALAGLENSKFDYDHTTDPSYQAYLDAYTRQGNSASETALSQTAANTGGIASSYAAAVANQMQQAYAKKATDMIPQLEQQAYERYANDLNNRFNLLNSYGALDQNAYQQFADNKNFNFNQFMGNYGNALQQQQFDRQMDWNQKQLAEQMAYDRGYLDWLAAENAKDRENNRNIALRS